ncbi:hypothetical protein quinque_007301 [Culex quinquefasciatus]
MERSVRSNFHIPKMLGEPSRPKRNRHQRSRQDQVPEPFDHDNRIHAAVSCGFAASTVDSFRVKWLSPPESAMCFHQTNHPATNQLAELSKQIGRVRLVIC